RSDQSDNEGRIYAGGQDELGYFSVGNRGQLTYTSLTNLLPQKDKSFGDVWDIVILKKDIFFRSAKKIIHFNGKTAVSYQAITDWSFLGVHNNEVFAQDLENGLLRFSKNAWVPIQPVNTLPKNSPITGILPFGNNKTLLTSLKNGLFVLENTTISQLPTPNNTIFSTERIYAAAKMNNGWYALATNNNGIYIINEAGDIIQQFSKNEDLQNNNVLSIFLDKQKNLWLGLDNGIDLITYNSAIKRINPLKIDGSGYATLIHDQQLYMGTSNGLFRVALKNNDDYSFSKGNFERVRNTSGQTWALASVNNKVLLGHHEGAFLINGNQATQISNEPGFWNFLPLNNVFPAQEIAAGNYTGIRFFQFSNNQFKPEIKLPNFEESSRYLTTDAEGNIWVSHPYHGVYRITKNENNRYEINSYSKKDGLPSSLNNHVFRVKNEIVIGTEKGVYQLNSTKNKFIPSAYYATLLGDKSIRYLRDDEDGNIWFIHEKNLGVIDFSSSKPLVIYLPELYNKLLSGFEFIYPANRNNIFIGGEKGFYHINYDKYKKTIPDPTVQIRKVIIKNTRDSVIYSGFKNSQRTDETSAQINNEWQTIQLYFTSPLHGYQSNLEYSYRLKGFENEWSQWNKRSEKEYTNLNEGSYTFEVKVRNNLGKESAISSYTFSILPPWYLSIWAKLIYAAFIITAMYLLYHWQAKRFDTEVKKMQEEQKKLKYIHELENSKTEGELAALRNAKLEAEISLKNAEMASTAMHLVKKGELLGKIKAELSHIMKRMNDEQAITEIKKMIKSLNEDENIDEEWENFTKHFDKVHGDFVVRLKDAHPNLSGNELKTCTYLRMNLSTKEIAQLMNISVRGVEISRYRLRKKLNIPSETSLFDYLITV
ncbi:MAG: ligand-binding sensor domain-containing protein, partial [Chitinophagaceae bacterium]